MYVAGVRSYPTLTNNTYKYCDEFFKLSDGRDGRLALLPVSSSTPSFPEILSHVVSCVKNNDPIPQPFLNHTVPQAYTFFKDHLRQLEDERGHHPFAHFTFLAVDDQCIRPSSPLPESAGSPSDTGSSFTILLCTDAPDFHESDTEPRLKTLRLPIAAAFTEIEKIEELFITPSELYRSVFESGDFNILKLIPPARFFPVPPFTNDDDQEYRLASPVEMRQRKKQGLRIGEQSQWGPGSL
ncbi:MAG: hypothetical protein L6R39_004128 [Caloplaca ligustica]|nr:MAG: hypothetical protein L6R39_004128 [Caloplaca ligustica]